VTPFVFTLVVDGFSVSLDEDFELDERSVEWGGVVEEGSDGGGGGSASVLWFLVGKTSLVGIWSFRSRESHELGEADISLTCRQWQPACKHDVEMHLYHLIHF
jgi:hypothetical protein